VPSAEQQDPKQSTATSEHQFYPFIKLLMSKTSIQQLTPPCPHSHEPTVGLTIGLLKMLEIKSKARRRIS
jgi:hypothetical protein